VIVGDGQWGEIHVYDLINQSEKWKLTNPEWGVINIGVGDVDNDGVADLLWGSGSYLYIANTTAPRAIKWQNVALNGPFLGPMIGDLDGDFRQELVVACNGRILVFDMATLTLRAMSGPGAGAYFYGMTANDLKLRDVDGDGRMEIVLASGNSYDGVIEVYSFSASNTFTLKWTNTTRPSGNPFNFVEVADLDANGTSEMIVGNNVAHTGSDGVYVYIFDYPTTAYSWRSVNLASNFSLVKGLVVADVDGNGTKDIAALVSTGDLYTWDGPTRQLKDLKQQTAGTLITDRVNPPGLILADTSGVGHFYKFLLNDYVEDFPRQLGSGTLDGVTVLPNGALFSGYGGILTLRTPPLYTAAEWQSPNYGTGFGRFVAADNPNGEARVFSSAAHAIAGFKYSSSLPTPSPSSTPTPTPSPTPTATATATATSTPTATATATAVPASMGNISTRLPVGTGDSALIGGFIVGGNQPKKVLVRGIGPSLASFGLSNPLANPTLELHDGNGQIIAFNNDWRTDHETEIAATGIPPSHDLESAIIMTLPAGNAGYTAVLRGFDQGTGVGVIEIYDLDSAADSTLVNISVRGLVQTGNNVLIAGTIILGDTPQKVMIRAIGPSLNVPGKLANPFLELRDPNGNLLRSNDDWRSDHEAEIIATGIAPSNDREAAIIELLPAHGSAYTAVVQGVGGATGIGVVEVYGLK
jgi:FG-GAP-like repeat